MPSFNYVVDTEPMAREISSVSRNINITTGAVVTMQTALIAAEKLAADQVCSNINNGFYSLIRSQISQKMANLQSEVDSLFMQLTQQKMSLLAIRDRMQRDYNMISARYIKLFNGINANLRKRIFELDKPVTNFAQREIDKILNRSKYLTTTVPVSQLESVVISQKVLTSSTKKQSEYLISKMCGFVHEMNLQKILINQILIFAKNAVLDGFAYIPLVIYSLKERTDNPATTKITITAVELTTNVNAKIRYQVFNELKSLAFKTSSKDQEYINIEFGKILNESQIEDRIKDQIKLLFKKTNYEGV